jgi:hypothetical protein
MSVNLEDFEKLGTKSKLFEFSQPGLDLAGSIIRGGKMEGTFGAADIMNVRYHPTILLQGNQIRSTHNETSKAVIVKSFKNRKSAKMEENKNEEDEPHEPKD